MAAELEFDSVSPPPDTNEEDNKKENVSKAIVRHETIQAKVNSKLGIR